MMGNLIGTYLFQGGGSGSPGIGFALWPLVFVFVFFYFLMILPQQRKQKKWQAMINDLKSGDRVTTSGGIRGIIIAVKDDTVHLRVAPDNLRVEVTKAAVISLVRDEEPPKT